MREITRSVKVAVKCLIAVVLVDDDLPYWTSNVEHLVAFTAIFSNIIVLRMRRNGYLWTFSVNLNTALQFADPDFLLACKISASWRRYRWFLHFIICRMSAIFLLPVYLTYWPRKYTTRVDPHVDNSHQVWSPYADPFLSYEWYRFPLVTIENAYAATAHAPNHVTRK